MQQALSLASRVRIADSVLSHTLAGEEVILNLNTGVYFGLDPVGTRIWHLLQEHQSLKKVFVSMLAEYEVTKDQCAQDLLRLLVLLKEKGLLDVYA
jgi:hypothetical protein